MKPIRRRVSYVFHDSRLYARVQWNGRRYDFTTGLTVEKDKFENGRCRNNTSHGPQKTQASEINAFLRELEDRINLVFYEFEQSEKDLTPALFKEKMFGKPTLHPSVWSSFDDYIAERSRLKSLTENSVRSILQVKKMLAAFAPDLKYETLTRSKVNDFIEWQKGNKLSGWNQRSGQSGYSNNVIMKHCRQLKGFLRWSSAKGYLDATVCEGLSAGVKSIDRPVVFLTPEELQALATHSYDEGSDLDVARDFFCFCCYTSLRYSDAHSLLHASVKNDHISVTSKKTGKNLVIELNSGSRKILDKYKNNGSEYALPRITNSRINILLKRIGKDCGIDEPVTITQYYGSKRVSQTFAKYDLLSSHCGRRTFICYALSIGIPIHVVMKWTGHSDFNAMKPYIDASDSVRRKSMDMFDAGLNDSKGNR